MRLSQVITADQIKKGSVSSQTLSAAIGRIAQSYNTATATGSAYLTALSAFSQSAGTASDRAAIIGATLKASQGDALGFGSAMATAYTANRNLISGFTQNAQAISDFGKRLGTAKLSTQQVTTAQRGLQKAYADSELAAINLTTGTIDYTKAGAGPLISSLQQMQDAATAAASATFQHELATKGAGQAATDAAAIFRGETYDALVKDAGQLGLTAGQAKNLADKYFAIPPSVTTTVKQLGTADVVNVLDRIGQQLSFLTGRPFTTTVDAATAAADSALDHTNGLISNIPSYKSIVIDVSARGVPLSAVDSVLGVAGANGMIVQAYANGGLVNAPKVKAFAPGGLESQMPQIARTKPGTVRVWAEPETRGESYIPHANDHRRQRAHQIMAQTARTLGGRYSAFTEGGIQSYHPNVPTSGTSASGPRKVTLQVGQREFEAYMSEIADGSVGSALGTVTNAHVYGN